MLHNICISAVAMSLRWASRGPLVYPTLLKHAQIVCIIVRINPIENEETCQMLWEKGLFKILINFFSLTWLTFSTLGNSQ